MSGDSVSVVMAAFNAASYITQAIESIVEHNGSNVRVIVVNDGSTDETPARVRAFGERVTFLEQENKGIYAAQNRGIRVANGDWLTFLDADDVWAPGYLEKLMSAFIIDPDLNIVFGHSLNFYSPETDEAFRARVNCPPDPMPGMGTSTMLIRRSDFMRVGLFDPAWNFGSYVEWISRARAIGLREHTISDVVLYRRLHPHNSGLRQNSQREYARVLGEIIKRKRAASATT